MQIIENEIYLKFSLVFCKIVCFYVMYVNDTTQRFLMSLRYITSILSLSASTFLCGADHAGKQFGSPTGIENASFSSALAAAPESFSAISRQASGYAEEPNTPLGKRDPNRPVSRAGTPCARTQSELLSELDLIFKMERPTAQGDNLDHLTDKQRLGLNHRNKIIIDTIYLMILNDAALFSLHNNVRNVIADTMVQNMQTVLGTNPDIWKQLPKAIQKHIIEASPRFHSTEDGWFYILEDWISLDYFLFLVDPAAVQEGSPRMKNPPRHGSSMHRCDSF